MGLDLIAKRKERMSGFDANTPTTYDITAGDVVIARLTKELPLAVLEPVKGITSELVLLIGTVYEGYSGEKSQDAIVKDVLDFLTVNPDLPARVTDILTAMGTRLFGESGMAEFHGLQPSIQDVIALVTGLFEWFGMSPGESSGSSESQTESGTTSTTTSDAISGSTPETSSETPVTPDSSVPAA